MRLLLVIPSHWVSITESKHSAIIGLVLRLAAEDQQIRFADIIDQICDSSTWRKCQATRRKNRQSIGVASLLHQQWLVLLLMTNLLVIRSVYGSAAAAVDVAGERMPCLHVSLPPLPPRHTSKSTQVQCDSCIFPTVFLTNLHCQVQLSKCVFIADNNTWLHVCSNH
jgi:hypothetical protein